MLGSEKENKESLTNTAKRKKTLLFQYCSELTKELQRNIAPFTQV